MAIDTIPTTMTGTLEMIVIGITTGIVRVDEGMQSFIRFVKFFLVVSIVLDTLHDTEAVAVVEAVIIVDPVGMTMIGMIEDGRRGVVPVRNPGPVIAMDRLDGRVVARPPLGESIAARTIRSQPLRPSVPLPPSTRRQHPL